MSYEAFICLGGVEIANMARTFTYATTLDPIPDVTLTAGCTCDAYDEGFVSPASDPAPWYEATRPESADFYGMWARQVRPLPTMSRATAPTSRYGSHIGSPRYAGQLIEVTGEMYAVTTEAMAYGERWMREVLRGSPCVGDGCASDDLIVLPACPEGIGSEEADPYFRTLVDSAVVEGPTFSPLSDGTDAYVQEISFTVASQMPWLYHPVTRCLDADDIAGGLDCSLDVPEFMGQGTFRFELYNPDTVAAEDIVIEGRVSLDGSCPVVGLGTSVPLSWSYTVTSLEPEDRLVIDGLRRKVLRYDASCKRWSAGLASLDFSGPFRWPDVGPCTTMCVTLEAVGSGAAAVLATVDSALREL